MKSSILIILVAIFINGCSVKDFFTLGESQTICEEENCDYKDAGVCMNPYDILEDKDYVRKQAYKDFEKGKN